MNANKHLRRFCSRRSVLAGLGASTAVLPFLPRLSREAEAAGKMPKRLILMFHPHGTIRERWLPTGTTDNFTLPEILAPLVPHATDITVVDGLEIRPQGPVGGPHTVGPAYLFTGSRMEDGNDFDHGCCTPHGWNTGPSVDQVVAQAIGGETPYASLEFGVNTGGNHPGSRMIYSGPAAPMSPEKDPVAMFDRLFGDFDGDADAVAKLKARRSSVLDVVGPELEAVRNKVGADDLIKIDAHLDSVADLQARLLAQYTCETPATPMDVPPDSVTDTPTLAKDQIDLMVEALACGLTNVASIMFRRGENDGQPYGFLGVEEPHHELSHAGDDNVDARDKLTQIYTWYTEQFAYLLERLGSITEADGSRLLDNTLIVWGSEIARGNTHAWGPIPFVLAGGAGGSIASGKFLSYGEGDERENHCRLLTTVCQAMGLDEVDTFGNLDTGSGTLAGLLT